MVTVLSAMPISRQVASISRSSGGTADKDIDRRSPGTSERSSTRNFLAIEPAVQNRDVLLFAGDHVENGKPLHKAVLEFFRASRKQHAPPAERLRRTKRTGSCWLARSTPFTIDRIGVNAGAGGKADIDPRLSGAGAIPKRPGRLIHVELSPDFNSSAAQLENIAAIDFLDRDAQFARRRAGQIE